MLKIIKRGFSADIRDELTANILEKIKLGTRTILLVPEQQTVISETEMAKRLPPSSVLNFEVTNFTRLANTVFRSLGGLFGEYCDSVRESLIMWRTLSELSPLLELTSKRREIGAGVVRKALSAVKEAESFAIGTDDLLSSMENERIKNNPRLFAKLCDLQKIYSLYKANLSESYLDSQDMLAETDKRLRECPDYLSGACIFVEGFTSFTERQYSILATLATRAEVSVYFVLSGLNPYGFEYGEISRAEEKLKGVIRRRGGNIKLENRLADDAKYNSPLQNIAESLWLANGENVKHNLQSEDNLRIFEAQTPFDEADFIASDIRRRVYHGARYSDFAIISRDAGAYAGIIDCALLGQGIPHFTSRTGDVASYEIIKLIYTAYNMILRGFRREELLTYAKCSLSGISREECDELELYIDTWQINGERFTDGLDWNMNPAGYTSRRAEGVGEALKRINDTRRRLIEPLMRFADEARCADSVLGQATALVKFMREMRLEAALSERTSALRASGEVEMAEEEGALWSLIINTLDLIVEISGELPCDAEGFLAQLKVAFSAREFGRIPVFRDVVTIGSADMLRLFDKKHIYMIGVLEDVFPASVTDGSYFTDKDKNELNLAGLELTPDTDIKAARELYIFTRALSYAGETVTLTYPSHNTAFKLVPPASVIGKIKDMSGVLPVRVESIPRLDLIYSPEYAVEADLSETRGGYAALRRALLDRGFEEILKISESDVRVGELKLDGAVSGEIYGGTIRLSQSAIDRYLTCPLSHFLQYALRLGEERRAEFDARNIGTFIHAILEGFFGAIREREISPADLTGEERLALTEECARDYIRSIGEEDIDSPRTRVKIERLKKAAKPIIDTLADELLSSRFTPAFFELPIGKSRADSLPDAITYKAEGGDILIYGIVDRVDTLPLGDDVAVRVIDYKTGSKEFSPDDMREGKNLQMFLYLKAICDTKNEAFRERLGVKENGKIIPAGVIYVKTSLSDVTIDSPSAEEASHALEAAQKREGMVLDNENIISAMGLKYTPLYSERKPDEIASTKRKYLYDEAAWEEIMNDIEEVVRGVVSRMRGGDISAIPRTESKAQHTPCEYCNFKAVCRNVRTK